MEVFRRYWKRIENVRKEDEKKDKGRREEFWKDKGRIEICDREENFEGKEIENWGSGGWDWL